MHRLEEELKKAGYIFTDPIVADSKWHFGKANPKDKRTSARYKAFFWDEGGERSYGMYYGDWETGKWGPWFTKAVNKMDRYEKRRVDDFMRAAQREQEVQRKELAAKAQDEAARLMSAASPDAGDNLYLKRKGITNLYGAKTHRKEPFEETELYIPLQDIDGKLRNIERIIYVPEDDNFKKRGLPGGIRSGLFHIIGCIESSNVVCIAEGYSTAVAVHEATEFPCISACTAGNIPGVAFEIARKFPDKNILITGDDDWENEENIGVNKAMEAAQAVGGKYVIPKFQKKIAGKKTTDFDDLLKFEGKEEVRRQILFVNPLVAIEEYDESHIVNMPFPDQIITQKGEKRLGTEENIAELCRRLRIKIKYNVMAKKREIIIPDVECTQDNEAVVKYSYIQSWCERAQIPHTSLLQFIDSLADINQYSPVVTWIGSKPWDGVSRMVNFADTIHAEGEESDPEAYALKQQMIRKWLISAAAAAFEPKGISAAGVLVLQGKQYIGKTKWFKNLAPAQLRALKDGIMLDPKNRDSVYQAIQHWIVELGELDATFRKADIAQLKAFLTSDRDVLRLPYARENSDFPRRTVFFASVNESDYLRDSTGNRRFWTIRCDRINYDHGIDMQQLWAEVTEIYRGGETWYLDQVEMGALNSHNETFEQVHPMLDLISGKYDWDSKDSARRWVSAAHICEEIGYFRPTHGDKMHAAQALLKLGAKDKKTNISKVYLVPRQRVVVGIGG